MSVHDFLDDEIQAKAAIKLSISHSNFFKASTTSPITNKLKATQSSFLKDDSSPFSMANPKKGQTPATKIGSSFQRTTSKDGKSKDGKSIEKPFIIKRDESVPKKKISPAQNQLTKVKQLEPSRLKAHESMESQSKMSNNSTILHSPVREVRSKSNNQKAPTQTSKFYKPVLNNSLGFLKLEKVPKEDSSNQQIKLVHNHKNLPKEEKSLERRIKVPPLDRSFHNDQSKIGNAKGLSVKFSPIAANNPMLKDDLPHIDISLSSDAAVHQKNLLKKITRSKSTLKKVSILPAT